MKTTLLALTLSFTLAATPQDEVILVALGGYNSCGSAGPTEIGMYPAVHRLAEDLKTIRAEQRKVHFLIACLQSSAPPKGQGQFLTSRVPGKLFRGTTDDIQKEIEALAAPRMSAPIFMAGHSYGGWQVMHLTLRLNPDLNLHGIFTIDPISPRCGPSQVIFGGEDCKQAPKEFDNKKVRDRVTAWDNFYQDQDSWLNSSSIFEARNHHIVYNGPHTSIDSDDRTWDEIRGSVYSEVD